MSTSPTELARAALRRIAEERLPPTPDVYARLYYETAGIPQPQPVAVDTNARADLENQARVDQLDSLVDKIVATSESLASGLDQGRAQMEASLDSLIVDAPANDTVQLLQVIVATAKDMHVTLKASHAELRDTQNSLTALRAELTESRKLLGQDALTGTENRRVMDAILEREMASARKEAEALSVAMIDLDHFKRVNDTYGHAAGDAALVHLTQLAKSMLRGHDAFIRYGGEEFLLVLPQTGLDGALYVAGRLQALLAKSPLIHAGKTIEMRFSAGVAAFKDEDTEASFVARADAALYDAKRSGRNKVVAAP
jgi:diguanylate cyclase